MNPPLFIGGLPLPPATLSAKNYAFLQRYIHAESGIVIEADKHYLIEARLLPILKEHRIDSLDTLSHMLAERSSASMSRLVIEAMTTNETLFFRDPAMFEALKTEVLPELFAHLEGGRKLRIWSAAASSGQEAYSIAMLLLEMGKTKGEVEIIATDISSQVLARACQAKYAQFEVSRGLPAPYLMKYFSRAGLNWQLCDKVRDLVSFDQLDLRNPFNSLGRFDLILCRNVLIYFDIPTRAHILQQIEGLMRPRSILVLGCAEIITNVNEQVKRRPVNRSTFYSL